MIINLLTHSVTNAASKAVTQGITAGFTLIAISWLIGLAILIGTAALITIVVKKIWYWKPKQKTQADTQKNWNNHYRHSRSDDWLHDAQERQNRRYDYTDPYTKPRKQRGSTKPQNEPNWYPTGWYWNEEKQLWEPPDYIKNESNEKWIWDVERQIWIDREKQKRIDRYKEFRKSQGKEPTFEEWKAAREKEQHPEN